MTMPGTTPRQWPPAQQTQLTAQLPPPLPDDNDAIRVADFSYTPKPLYFTMDGERYDCFPSLPVTQIEQLTEVFTDGMTGIDPETITKESFKRLMRKLTTVFNTVLLPESAQRFNARMVSVNQPLDFEKQVIPVMHWILEQHGMRPTTSSLSSTAGQHDDETGTTSTDGASHGELVRQN